MANILGIDYYRIVSETGKGEWSQVYVKMAFDKEELDRFGSIFGVVKISGKGDLVTRGMALIGEIDRWCDDAAHKGDVSGLLAILSRKLATGVFAWIYVDDSGGRRLKAGALPGNGVAILRGGNRVWLFEDGDGRVVTGEAKEKDKLFFGSKEAIDLIDKKLAEEDLEEMTEGVTAEVMRLPEGARAALILVIKAMVIGTKKEVSAEEILVGNRVVGAIGVTGKIASAKMSWKEFVGKWQSAGRLREEGLIRRRHRLFLFIGVVFLVVLGMSVSLGLVKAKKDRADSSFKAVYEPLEKKRADAEALFSLNPVGARDILRLVKEEVATKKSRFVKTAYEGRMNDLEKAVESSWAKVSGEQKSNLDLFFSLGLIRSQMKGDRMAFNGKELLVLDSGAGIVAKISYPDKRQEVSLGKGGGQSWLDVAGAKDSTVLLTKTGLIAILSGKKNDLVFDAAVTDPVSVDVFPGAAYVLDRGASEIWRYGLSGGVISDRRRWFVPGVETDFRTTMDIAIDVDIWVGMTNGKILRFRRGQPEKFSLTDVPEGFSIKRLAVSSDAKVIAVLDSDKSRIVLFNKETGAYVKQILASELSSATDIVWVTDRDLMILSGDKLYTTAI